MWRRFVIKQFSEFYLKFITRLSSKETEENREVPQDNRYFGNDPFLVPPKHKSKALPVCFM
jgi:hypothetical protein